MSCDTLVTPSSPRWSLDQVAGGDNVAGDTPSPTRPSVIGSSSAEPLGVPSLPAPGGVKGAGIGGPKAPNPSSQAVNYPGGINGIENVNQILTAVAYFGVILCLPWSADLTINRRISGSATKFFCTREDGQ
jgi:hypothetical protein